MHLFYHYNENILHYWSCICKQKPHCGVKVCSGHSQSLISLFSLLERTEGSCWQELGTKMTQESSPYQSPLTLACPCVWAQSPSDSGKNSLVLALLSCSFACQSAISHSVQLHIKIRVWILGIYKHSLKEKSVFFFFIILSLGPNRQFKPLWFLRESNPRAKYWWLWLDNHSRWAFGDHSCAAQMYLFEKLLQHVFALRTRRIFLQNTNNQWPDCQWFDQLGFSLSSAGTSHKESFHHFIHAKREEEEEEHAECDYAQLGSLIGFGCIFWGRKHRGGGLDKKPVEMVSVEMHWLNEFSYQTIERGTGGLWWLLFTQCRSQNDTS